MKQKPKLEYPDPRTNKPVPGDDLFKRAPAASKRLYDTAKRERRLDERAAWYAKHGGES